jgi:hypothetical protein
LAAKRPLKLPDICLKVALVNGILFIISIGIFLFILIDNTLHVMEIHRGVRVRLLRGAFDGFNGFLVRINHSLLAIIAIYLTLFQQRFSNFFLFALALYKTIVSSSAKIQLNGRRSLAAILLHENIMYFFV